MTDIDLKRLAVDREYWDECGAPEKAQEAEWDGEGSPPVGCECEMIHPGIECYGWQKAVIKSYFDNKVAVKSNQNIWHSSDGYAVINIDNELQFRPIRTKAERERDELANIVSCDGMPASRAMEIADAILSKYNLEPKP